MEHTLDQFGKEKITPHPTRTAAIVLAAGQGKRMKSKIQKQFLLLEEKPVIWYALHAFEESRVDDVILVTGADEIAYCRDEIVGKYGFSKVRAIVAGGKERYHSVYEGLKALGSQFSYGEEPMIERIVSDIRSYSAAVAGMPSKDTVKLADADGFASVTPERAHVWMIQTPQGFTYPLIRAAYDKMMSREEYQQGVTDDAMVVETMTDHKVRLTEGSYRNIKVTTPEDMEVAAAFLKNKKS